MGTASDRVGLSDVGLLLIRGIVGVVFAFHGSQKLFGWFGGGGISATAEAMAGMGLPLPTLSAYLAGGAEFFGGVALIIGLAVPIAAVPLVITMLVASFVAHGHAFSLQHGGMEYALTLGLVTAGLGLTGGGRISVMALWPRAVEQPNAT